MTANELTPLEVELAQLLCGMVFQNLHEERGVYETGFIGIHKEVLLKLCKLGFMDLLYDGFGRVCQAKFKSEYDPENRYKGVFTK